MTDPTPAEIDVKELYESFGRAIYRRCQYFLRNDADAQDAMHDVFLKLVERHHEFRAESSPLTWVTRITTNHCLNLIRSQRAKWRERYEKTELVDRAGRETSGSPLERRQLVAAVIGRAEPETVAAAVFYFVDEMNQEDAAKAASCSVPTLRKRLRKFIEIARKELKKIDVDVVFGEAPV
jgi:RNA polymerase sigma factor (sigma-70 family)